MERSSASFSWHEMTRSTTARREGLSNVPNQDEAESIRALCAEVLQPLRDVVVQRGLAHYIHVNSGFRSMAVNNAVGGVRGSHHMARGGNAAADIEAPGLWNASLAALVLELGLPFSELILEYPSPHDPAAGWVHVSHNRNGNNDGDLFTITRQGGKIVRLPGLVAPGMGDA